MYAKSLWWSRRKGGREVCTLCSGRDVTAGKEIRQVFRCSELGFGWNSFFIFRKRRFLDCSYKACYRKVPHKSCSSRNRKALSLSLFRRNWAEGIRFPTKLWLYRNENCRRNILKKQTFMASVVQCFDWDLWGCVWAVSLSPPPQAHGSHYTWLVLPTMGGLVWP